MNTLASAFNFSAGAKNFSMKCNSSVHFFVQQLPLLENGYRQSYECTCGSETCSMKRSHSALIAGMSCRCPWVWGVQGTTRVSLGSRIHTLVSDPYSYKARKKKVVGQFLVFQPLVLFSLGSFSCPPDLLELRCLYILLPNLCGNVSFIHS